MTGSLLDILGLGPAEVVAAVGAGGKTSFLERLARAYEAEGGRVVLVTTTKVRAPDPGSRPLVVADQLPELLSRLATRPGRSPVVGRRLLAHGKVEGVPPEWVQYLRDIPWAAGVLVEADGALGRPLKAPAPWEPVLPSCASLVVAMAGLDAQDIPLDDAHVHRAALVAELLGDGLGDGRPSAPRRLPPAALLTVLLAGYRAGAPATARFAAVLTKADLAAPASALVAAAKDAPVEVWTWSAPDNRLECLGRPVLRPAALVLAAGRGTRMGGPKLTAVLGGGTVLTRVVGTATAGGRFHPVVVVVGGEVGDLEAEEVLVVRNPRPEEGMASSLRRGVAGLDQARDLAVLLADQPLVSPATLARLLEARAAAPRAAAVALAGGAGPAPPLILHRSLLPQLLELTGDRGARDLLRRFRADVVSLAPVGEEGLDVDTAEDLARARRLLTD